MVNEQTIAAQVVGKQKTNRKKWWNSCKFVWNENEMKKNWMKLIERKKGRTNSYGTDAQNTEISACSNRKNSLTDIWYAPMIRLTTFEIHPNEFVEWKSSFSLLTVVFMDKRNKF